MRCSYLLLPPLFGATMLLTIANISSSSPTNPSQPKDTIGSPDIPKFHTIKRSASPPDGGGSSSNSPHLPRHHKRELLTPSNHPSPRLLQRHDHITAHLRSHTNNATPSPSSLLAKRTLASDLAFLGFRLIWDHADVIVSSTLAYYRTTEYYANMTRLAGGEFSFGPTVQNYAITYGCFRLFFEPWADAVGGMAAEVFPDGLGPFVRGFAQLMLLLTQGVVLGTFAVLAWSAAAAVWITMEVVERADLPGMVTGPT